MATKKRAAPRRRAASVPGRAKTKGRRRTSYKNKSIAGDIASLGILLGVAVSPVAGKMVESVRAKSPAPMASWTKDEMIRTGITIGGGMIGGKIAGNVLNKVKPVKFAWNKGKKMVRGVF